MVDVETMKSLMTKNSWKTDPLSAGCPGNAIAARFDIRGPSCSMRVVANGATDSKITTSKLVKTRAAYAYSGPVYNKNEGIAPFCWSKFGQSPPDGQPDCWEMPWIIVQPNLNGDSSP